MIRFLSVMPASHRDSVILFSCIGLLLLVNQLVWEPWEAGLAAQQERVASMQFDLAGVERLADKMKALPSRQKGGERLLTQVNLLASQYDVQLEAVRPMGSAKVSFSFSAVEKASFWQWLAQLEKDGVMLERLNLSSRSEAGRLGGQITVAQVGN